MQWTERTQTLWHWWRDTYQLNVSPSARMHQVERGRYSSTTTTDDDDVTSMPFVLEKVEVAANSISRRALCQQDNRGASGPRTTFEFTTTTTSIVWPECFGVYLSYLLGRYHMQMCSKLMMTMMVVAMIEWSW